MEKTIIDLLKIDGNKATVHRVTGISRTALHKIQQGISDPGSRTYAKICKALGEKPEEIYANEDYVKE